MREYKVMKWGYVEELEDLLNQMTNEGWRFDTVEQPRKWEDPMRVGTVVFSRESQRLDEEDQDE